MWTCGDHASEPTDHCQAGRWTHAGAIISAADYRLAMHQTEKDKPGLAMAVGPLLDCVELYRKHNFFTIDTGICSSSNLYRNFVHTITHTTLLTSPL